MCLAQGEVGVFAGQVALGEINQKQVVVGAAGDNCEAPRLQPRDHCPGIVQHALLIVLEIGLHGFLKSHRLGGDHMHQGPPLIAGEDQRIQLAGQLLVGTGEDHAAARAAQGLVGGGGADIGMRHRARVMPGGH